MSREQASDYEEEEEVEETDDEEETPAPVVVKKPVAKKPVAAPAIKKPSVPQVQYVKIPVFESQAMQLVYDLLLDMNQRLDKINADLELMKKYLPQED